MSTPKFDKGTWGHLSQDIKNLFNRLKNSDKNKIKAYTDISKEHKTELFETWMKHGYISSDSDYVKFE